MDRPFFMVAPTGARRGKVDQHAVPVTRDEVVATAVNCRAAATDALHLKVRDNAGMRSRDEGLRQETPAEMSRAAPEMRMRVTTEVAGLYAPQQQVNCLRDFVPVWVSISLRENAGDPDLAQLTRAICSDEGTDVQHILHDTSNIALLDDWQARGIELPRQDSMLFALGRYATGQVSSPDDLAPFLASASDRLGWIVRVFGPAECSCKSYAARQGKVVRVGFENSLTSADGTLHFNNAASVASPVSTLERHVA